MTSSFATANLLNPNGSIVKKVFPPTIFERVHISGHYRKQKKTFSIQITILALLFLALLSSFGLSAQEAKLRWVDSVFQKLSTAEKIGQLFMIPVSSNASNEEISLLSAQFKKYKPGSLHITQGSPIRHVRLMKKLQSQANVPLLTAIHAEQGVASCLDSTIRFAPPMKLGAIQNEEQVFSLGVEIGRQMNLLGLHLSLIHI